MRPGQLPAWTWLPAQILLLHDMSFVGQHFAVTRFWCAVAPKGLTYQLVKGAHEMRLSWEPFPVLGNDCGTVPVRAYAEWVSPLTASTYVDLVWLPGSDVHDLNHGYSLPIGVNRSMA